MRRTLILAIAILIALPAIAQEQSITPDQLWTAILNGNKEFVAGNVTYPDLKKERLLFSQNQLPPITVLACSDSRVPPELIFNQSLGALFVVRTAGNIADDFGLASMEFAIANNWTKLIVVLAHEHCGAVKSSLGGADPSTPALRALSLRIRSSFVGIPYDSRDEANVRKAIEANARASAAHLLAASIMIRDAVATEKIKIVTAYYDLDEGTVKKLE
jgi:carbonic anhydrase